MTVNPKTKQILLTTTPRDSYVEIPGISGGQKDKLTHIGIYGVDKSMDTLEALYGIEINYYARVNFSSLIKIVDVLGGIDVNSEYSFNAGGYSFEKGIFPAILTKANSLLASVSDSVETNMTKDEMAELSRMQLDEASSWNIVSVNAVGTGDTQVCFSSGKQRLYVMQPDMTSIAEIRKK